ncbi:hypothetical protein DEU56DRAFT_242395 [Suillus clintonianus]|uniref:uncharacterized protein n=1 Tax=Suillus clintonianus TaxID=1904413 RepID=UPI001B8751FB|nr:uncharacterized protein DEU56DRAFT_242395 [Suillus clintonianus]KAG2143581.1 hypothetical protein DEU56DRAFT_242395 [Suillus clintonianus]
MKLSVGETFHLRVGYKRWFGLKHDEEDIAFEPEEIFRIYGASERQEYIKFHKKIRIVVELSGNTTEVAQVASSSGKNSELQPTTDEISRICPRFRILVIGKTGVGKSSLINQAFGVEKTLTSHEMPGKAEIDTEFISQQNGRFVLHDSKGFEPGEVDNLQIVRDFIQRRRNMSALEHQLHAVWLCFEIPRAGGRLLETGTEEFLSLKRDGTLGNIPVVVVLTKYDMLLDRTERTLDALVGSNDETIKELTKNKAEAELQNICIGPLEEFAGPDIPHAVISTEECHKETLARLIRMTENSVRQHLAPEAAVMASIAQRVDTGLKINASIEVGKTKYWKALASSTTFKNRKTWDCLNVLHIDIVAVWNFYDPHHYLRSQEFREMMVKMVDTLEVGPTADPSRTVAIGLSMVGTIAGIMAALAGPAAPIVVPIAAGVVLAVWAHDVYQISHAVLQRFMSYIVHLTLVLQTLYLVSENQELTRRAIKLAVASYLESEMGREVHTRIQEYDRKLTLLTRADRDALDKIIEVMQFYSISAAQMSDLRAKIPAVGSLPDESWDMEPAKS